MIRHTAARALAGDLVDELFNLKVINGGCYQRESERLLPRVAKSNSRPAEIFRTETSSKMKRYSISGIR